MREDLSVKCILASTMAKYLLRQGFNIIDLKPQRDDPRRTVFIFDDSEGKIGEVMKNYKPKNPCELGVYEQ